MNRDVAAPTTDDKGKWLGLVLVVVFCASILVTTYQASERYYSKNMVSTDTSYFLMSVGILLQGRDDFDLRHVLDAPTPLQSSDHGTDVYVLHNLSAWLLRAVLPLRPCLAVILNGLWFSLMAVSVYLLLWERTRVWRVAALVTASFLVANPYLPTVLFGITSLDPNLHAFMIGTSALCWVLLSDSFRKHGVSIIVGLFLGCLVLARVYTLGIVLPAMLPFVVASLWTRSRSELRASLIGGTLAVLAMLAFSGFWLFPRLGMLQAYTTQFKSAGILGRTSLTATAVAWLRVAGEVLRHNLPVLCVLFWSFIAQLRGAERGLFRQMNWSHVWLAICPLLILTWLGTSFGPYGALAIFGLYLTLLFPLRAGAAAILQRRDFALALAAATALGAFRFFSSLAAAHEVVALDKQPLTAAIESIRQDAARSHRPRVTVGLVQWGKLHDASLVDSLIFDAGIRIATPTYPPKPRAGSALVVDPMVLDNWVWDRRIHGDQAMTPDLWVSQLTQAADYVIVLAADAAQRRRGGRWPPWVKASRLLLRSSAFRTIAGPFDIPSDGNVLVLARR
ncbi:MAG TPA: hypothetical protein VF331_08990 [Polyangiales bacterium]